MTSLTVSNPGLWLDNAGMVWNCPKGQNQSHDLKEHMEAVLPAGFWVGLHYIGGRWGVQVFSKAGWGMAQLETAILIDREMNKFLKG